MFPYLICVCYLNWKTAVRRLDKLLSKRPEICSTVAEKMASLSDLFIQKRWQCKKQDKVGQYQNPETGSCNNSGFKDAD